MKNLNYEFDNIQQAQNEPQNEPNEPNEPIQDRNDLDEKEKKILGIIISDSKVTRAEIVEYTGYSLATVKRVLITLKNKGVISREGSARNGNWIVK